MDAFLENAQEIFDVAKAASLYPGALQTDFALAIRPDGGLHFVMESPLSIDAVANYAGAETAYRVIRSAGGVRVEGRNQGRGCVIEERRPARDFLRDQAFYRITSPVLSSAPLLSGVTATGSMAAPMRWE